MISVKPYSNDSREFIGFSRLVAERSETKGKRRNGEENCIASLAARWRKTAATHHTSL